MLPLENETKKRDDAPDDSLDRPITLGELDTKSLATCCALLAGDILVLGVILFALRPELLAIASGALVLLFLGAQVALGALAVDTWNQRRVARNPRFMHA